MPTPFPEYRRQEEKMGCRIGTFSVWAQNRTNVRFFLCRHAWCVLMFLPNSLAHMCSRITSVFISLSQGGQTEGFPKTEKMLSVKCQRNSPIVSKSRVIVTKCFLFLFCFFLSTLVFFPKLFLYATLWKVCNWLSTVGCSFLSERREFRLSLIIYVYENFSWLSSIFFLKGL